MTHLRVSTALVAALLSLPSLATGQDLIVLDEHVLRPSVPVAGERFGHALALDGEWLAVGAPQTNHQPGQGLAGAVYLFRDDGSGTGWVQVVRLVPSAAAGGDAFGESVALDGSTLIVGAPRTDSACPGQQCESGAIYTFEFNGTAWNEIQTLVRTGIAADDQFGASVALDGTRLLVGAPWGEGWVVRYEYVGSGWVEVENLVQTNGPDFASQYGAAVALEGDRALVGAPGLDLASYDSGAGYLWQDGVSGWSELTRLAPASGATLTSAGRSVALSGDRAVIGGLAAYTSGPGRVWMFNGASGAWVEEAELVASDGAIQDDFGIAIALEDTRLIAGAPGRDAERGAVYVREFDQGSWVERLRLDGAAPGEQLGRSLALAGELLAAGSPGDDIGGANAGSVTVYRIGTDFVNYCLATTNSTGFAAILSATGSTSVAANDLVLHASPVPDQPGLFYYGAGTTQVAFGNGFQCVTGGGVGLQRLPVEVASGSLLSHAVDFGMPPTVAGTVTPGSTWYFQAWYRDPFAGGSAFNLSDGLEALFVP